jgi:hypothetical protein
LLGAAAAVVEEPLSVDAAVAVTVASLGAAPVAVPVALPALV